MSDSESDSEGDKLRKTKRNVVVKFEFKDSEDDDESGSTNSTTSGSGSDDDADDGPPTKFRAKRCRQLPQNSSSDNDSEPIVMRIRNAKKNVKKPYVYSGGDSSDSSWCPGTNEVGNADEAGPSTSSASSPIKAISTIAGNPPDDAGLTSDTSDDATTEKCPICLHTFREQEIGTPDICDHAFCAPCIEEWSKNVQTCPIDRKEFSYISVTTKYENGRYVRKIQVIAQSTVLDIPDDDDLTHCEVCTNTDREDCMLLCDGCNRGYHMNCLNPPLTEIPQSSWYCDYCFESEDSTADEDDLGQLIAEMNVIGVPETRLRVRRVGETPRITRTRQSERIRATILSRIAPSRRHASSNSLQSSLGMSLPGPSRITTTTTTTTKRTTRTTTTRRKKRKVRKSKKRNSRTYVVEYEVNNFDGNKFPATTTKRIIKRRRKGKRKVRKTSARRRKTSARCTATSRSTRNANSDTASASMATSSRSALRSYPTFRLFGDPNALDYFSDDDGANSNGHSDSENAGRGLGGGILSAALSRARIGSTSALRRQKRIVSTIDAGMSTAPNTTDVLSNIMDTMDRWHAMTRPAELEKIKLGKDGKLLFEGTIKKNDKVDKKSPEKVPEENRSTPPETVVTNAPMYPRGGSGTQQIAGGYNNNSNNNNSRYQQSSGGMRNGTGMNNNSSNTNSSGGGGSGGGGAGGNSSGGGGGSTSMSFSIFGPRTTPATPFNNTNSNINTNNRPNDFSTPPRFPITPTNNQRDQRNQRPSLRQRTPIPPFNVNQQRFPTNFTNRFSTPPPMSASSSSSMDMPTRHGLYDDPGMPPPHIPDIHNMMTPPIVANSFQQMHMNTPPPPMPPMSMMPPPLMGIPPLMANFPCFPNHSGPPPILPSIIDEPGGSNNQPLYNLNNRTQDDDIAAEDIPLPATGKPTVLSGLAAYGSDDDDEDEEEADDCPNFSLYSAESLGVAKADMQKDAADTADQDDMEKDEDLVQLDDEDDDIEALQKDPEEASSAVTQPESTDQTAIVTEKTEEDREEDKANKSVAGGKKNVLDLYDDSDWDEWNNEKTDDDNRSAANAKPAEASEADSEIIKEPTGATANEPAAEEDERSYTPCLDEQVNNDKSADAETNSKLSGDDDDDDEEGEDEDDGNSQDEARALEDANRAAGIAGMETELISDDEAEDILNDGAGTKTKDSKKTGDKKKVSSSTSKLDPKDKGKKKDKDDFKKISRSNKERNYRDKKYDKQRRRRRSRSPRSRTRSRSRSNNKENRGRMYQRDKFNRRDNKRKDMERYDVRNVIAERQPRTYKDKYGRDTSRPAKNNRGGSVPRRRRSKSGSRSRRSNSRFSESPPAQRRSLSKRRSPSRRRSISPRVRPRRSSPPVRRVSISPLPMLRRRTKSPIMLRDRSMSPPPPRKDKQINNRSRSPISISPPPVRLRHSRSFSRERNLLRTKVTGKSRKKSSTAVNEKKLMKRKTRKRLLSPEPLSQPITKKKAIARSRSPSWDNTKKLSSPWSRSPTPMMPATRLLAENDSSWTPPITTSGENLTVILKNKDNKRKREKKRRAEKRKETQQKRERRKQRSGNAGTGDKTDPSAPSKEVFASGDNILVSVSFNKDKVHQQQTTIVTLPPSKDQIVSKKQQNEAASGSRKSKKNSSSAAGGPSTSRKHKKIDMKPVAIIDLDRSPFKEMTPSPKAVIILSDSDHDDDVICSSGSPVVNNNSNKGKTDRPKVVPPSVGIEQNENRNHHDMEPVSQPQSPSMDEISGYDVGNTVLGGPKTPPEPSVVKFSLPLKTKNKLRPVNNPLHDAVDDEQPPASEATETVTQDNNTIESQQQVQLLQQQQLQVQQQQQQVQQSMNKVGPNTPPESGPCSPDAYDPFEPTKSASASPKEVSSPCDRIDSHTPDLPTVTTNDDKRHQPNKQIEKTIKPVDLAMALINSKASLDAAHSLLNSTLEGGINENGSHDIHDHDDDDDDDEDDVQIISSPHPEKTDDSQKQHGTAGIHIFSNVVISQANLGAGRSGAQQRQAVGAQLALPNFTTTAKSPATKTTTSTTPKQSPMKPKASSLISKLPLPKTKSMRHNGNDGHNDENMDQFESPYSPDSSDYDDLFEPPQISPPTASQKLQQQKKGNKGEMFQDLFGKISPVAKTSRGKRRYKKITSSKGNRQGKLTEEQIRILEDLPGSAVELQVKDQYLRKLNRQERVVEEVKLVLKPHYNKKHISKEDYKDILRRSVPKICHNRTGEINPKKIQALIEAYVRKFRHRRKQATGLPNV